MKKYEHEISIPISKSIPKTRLNKLPRSLTLSNDDYG